MSTGCAFLRPLPQGATAQDGRIITQQMIAASDARTAWDVVRNTGLFRMSDGSGSTRPSIRGRRGRSSIVVAGADVPHIIVDGSRVDDPGFLQIIPANTIAQMQILNGIEGSVREGLNSGGGVIYITSRVGT